MPDTAIAQAFKEAGFTAPTQRLRELAIEALVASPGDWDGAKDALFRVVSHDAALLWALFAPYRARAAHDLLSDVAVEARRQQTPRREPERGSGSGQGVCDRLAEVARPAPVTGSPRPAPSSTPPPRAAMDAIAAVAYLSLLDTFKVNGQPIGDVTPREAEGWARSRERDARFVRLLTLNLPLDMPIRRFRSGEEAAALYEQAKAAGDA